MELCRTFVSNIQGTYACPDKHRELRNCKQKSGESLHDYIRLFSKRITEIPGATDNDAISAFQNDTTCTTLIHHIGRRTPRTTREILDIATNHTDGEEAVAATLNTPQGKGKQVLVKKKKNNDKHRRDDNLVAVVECKATRPKNNPTKAAPKGSLHEALVGFVHPSQGPF
jgi:ethanolamine ammonia-lyase small subunit